MSAPRWLFINAATGVPIAEVPRLRVEQVTSTMSQFETADGVLPLAGMPLDEYEFTTPYAAAVLLLETGPDGVERPTWGGYVKDRTARSYLADSITIGMVTPDGYLERCYLDDEHIRAAGQLDTLKALIEKYALGGNGQVGVFGRVLVAGGAAGAPRTQDVLVEDSRTLMSLMTDWAGDATPVEWRTWWEKLDDGRYRAVFELGEENGRQVGYHPSIGYRPRATFSVPGNSLDARLDEDWSEGKGANAAQAVSDGTVKGDKRPPHSAVVQRTVDGRPLLLYRFTSNGTVSSAYTGKLYDLANRALDVISAGTRALTITARADRRPLIGVDWRPGDDLGYEVGDSPSFRGGMKGVARCNSYARTLGEEPTVNVTFFGDSIDTWVPNSPDLPEFSNTLTSYSRALGGGATTPAWWFTMYSKSDQDPIGSTRSVSGAVQFFQDGGNENTAAPADALTIARWAGIAGAAGAASEGVTQFWDMQGAGPSGVQYFNDFGRGFYQAAAVDSPMALHREESFTDVSITDKSWRLYFVWYLAASTTFVDAPIGVRVIFGEQEFASQSLPISVKDAAGNVFYLACQPRVWNSGSKSDMRVGLPAAIERNRYIALNYVRGTAPIPVPYPVAGFDPGPARLWTPTQLRALEN